MLPLLWSDEVEAKVRKNARNLDPQVTPPIVRQCIRCVVTNQRPRITLDEDGLCSSCKFFEDKKKIDWKKRELELSNLLRKNRRAYGNGYDVVVPCSGGKDSATVAHKLKHEYGMNPLCVLWEPFSYTDIGRQNKDAFVNSGFDVISMKPNGLVHRRLSRLALEYYGDNFKPFVFGQLCWPMQVAAKLGIKLVFGGENGEAYYGGDMKAANKPRWDTQDWDRIYTKGASVLKLFDLGCDLGAFDDGERPTQFYSLPSQHQLDGVEYHWWSYYKDHHPMENFYYAHEHTGFTPNDERSEGTYTKFASIDDKLDGLHYYFGWLKHGIGRCTSDAAQQVRSEDIDRDEALALVSKYDGEFPEKYLDEGLEYLGLDREHLNTVIERFKNKHLKRY